MCCQVWQVWQFAIEGCYNRTCHVVSEQHLPLPNITSTRGLWFQNEYIKTTTTSTKGEDELGMSKMSLRMQWSETSTTTSGEEGMGISYRPPASSGELQWTSLRILCAVHNGLCLGDFLFAWVSAVCIALSSCDVFPAGYKWQLSDGDRYSTVCARNDCYNMESLTSLWDEELGSLWKTM